MKILVLSYEYPPIGGGGGMICRHISENLARLGNEVSVITTAPPATTNHEPQTLNIIRLPSRRKNTYRSNPLEMLSWIRTTKKFIRNTPGFVDFDVCMAHFVLPGGEVALWLKKQFGLPYVLISHGHEIPWVHPRQMLFLHLGAYFRIKKVCMHSKLNFVQTRMMKANIDRFMGKKYRKKNRIVPNGVDQTVYCPDDGRRSERLRIIFTGRLVIQKDPMTFMRALRLFSRHTGDFDVHIAGDGDLRKRMERFARNNGLAVNVAFLGKVSGSQMVKEFQAVHLMVAPSLNEGMSIAALEALSCGVYLIATRASGFEDMIKEGENGEFIPFRDPKTLAARMINFYENHTRGQGRSDPPQGVRPGFPGWEEIGREYQRILTEALC